MGLWWLVHRVYNNSRHHNRNDFLSSLDSFVNLLHLQIVSYEGITTIFVVWTFNYYSDFQLSLALGDWWIGVFLGDTSDDNTISHIFDSMEALAAVRPSMFADNSKGRRKALAGDCRHRMVVVTYLLTYLLVVVRQHLIGIQILTRCPPL